MTVLADADKTGRECAQRIAATLHGLGAVNIRIALPAGESGDDIADWIGRGEAEAKIKALVQPWTPEAPEIAAPRVAAPESVDAQYRGPMNDALRLMESKKTGFLAVRNAEGGYRVSVLTPAGLWRRDSAQVSAWAADYAQGLRVDEGDADSAKWIRKWGSQAHAKEVLGALPGAIRRDQDRAARHGCFVCDEADLDPRGYLGTPSGVRALNDPFTVLDPMEGARLFVTQSTPVDPAPLGTEHPDVAKLFDHFDEKVLSFLLRAIGHALKGDPGKAFYFLTGSGNEGKSTAMAALRACLGSYCRPFPKSAITKDRNGTDRPNPDFEAIMKARIVYTSDSVPAGRTLDTDKIKTLAGSDAMPWRRMHEAHQESEPTATLVICANEAPFFALDDRAMLSRTRILEYPSFDKNLMDTGLIKRLKADREAKAALLTMLLAAGADTMEPPAPIVEVNAAVEAREREEEGDIGLALRDHVRKAPGAVLFTKDLFDKCATAIGEEPDNKKRIEGRRQGDVTKLARKLFRLPKATAVREGSRRANGWQDWKWQD